MIITNSKLRLLAAVFLFVFAGLPIATPALAASTKQAAKTDKDKQTLPGWQIILEGIEASLKRPGLDDETLARHRETLTDIIARSQELVTATKPKLDDAQSQFKKLGPAPKKDDEKESEEVQETRKKLGHNVAKLSGDIKTAEVLKLRSSQLIELVQDRRRTLFSRQILKRSKSPFSPGLWRQFFTDAATGMYRLRLVLSNWWGSMPSKTPLFWLIASALLVWLTLGKITKIWVRRFRTFKGDGRPEFFQKVSSAGWVTLARAAPPIAAAGLLYGGLWQSDLLTRAMDRLAFTGFTAFTTIAAVSALSLTLLAPNRSGWRLLPATDANARRLSWLLTLIVLVYGADLVLNELNSVVFAPLSLTILQSFIASLSIAGLLIAILRTPLEDVRKNDQTDEQGPQPLYVRTAGRRMRILRLPLWLLVIFILAATIFGYIALARFITSQLVITGTILVIVYLLHLSIRAFSRSFGNEKKPMCSFLETEFGFSQTHCEQLGLVNSLVLNSLLIVVALPLILVQWGFNWDDVKLWAGKFLFGFQIGNLSISLISILISILIFAVGIMITRLFQRWLDRRVLSRTKSQTGAEDSIRTGIGYLGIIISGLLAISYTGLDFSNFAIVAGALSLGIGFGLQSVVNNFVSGLILLVERPVKIGDWIVVGNDEGHVRRISVRSTEIETFDRSHIVIPNSQLISGTVKNWTLRSPLGRVIVPVGVAYDSDPELVEKILMDVAQDFSEVLDYPEPFVIFENFGASSLDFTLRAFVSNVNRSARVRSALRIKILKAFQQNNIEIPFPQSDIHLRDIEALVSALKSPAKPAGSRPRSRKKTSAS